MDLLFSNNHTDSADADLLFSNNHTDSADADEFLSCQDIEDVREDLDHDISQLSSRPNYVPVEFSETYYPLWKAFELHIDNRSFCANQHAVNAEIRRTCSEVTRVIRDIDKHGDLHTIFQTQDIGNVFETQIFSKMIHNIREFGLKRASSCANILRSLLKFLDFVSIHSNQYPTISESAILSVIKRTKQFKLIVEKKKSLRRQSYFFFNLLPNKRRPVQRSLKKTHDNSNNKNQVLFSILTSETRMSDDPFTL